MSRPSRDQVFMYMTQVLSHRSVCKRLKVGAIIVSDGRPISVGYNGPPSGFNHCTKCDGESCDVSIHAEVNAISYAAKNGVSIDGATLYCTDSPCINCAKAIISSGIRKVIFSRDYRLYEGKDILRKAGVSVNQLITQGGIPTWME